MSEVSSIQVRLIAATHLCRETIVEWLQSLGVSDDAIHGRLMELDDVELLVGLAAKRCYKSFEPGLNANVTRTRDDWAQYLDHVLSSGHGSVLEHASISFAVEGASRVFTAEMNRHRAGVAISEASMRFIRFDEDIPYWLPTSLQGPEVVSQTEVYDRLYERDGEPCYELDSVEALAGHPDAPAMRRQLTRAIFDDVFGHVQRRYAQLLKIWEMDESDKDFVYKKQVTSCLRRIVPMGASTGGVWTLNVRALRHVLTMRCAPEAEEEIRDVATKMCELVLARYPLLFGDFARDLNTGAYRPTYRKV